MTLIVTTVIFTMLALMSCARTSNHVKNVDRGDYVPMSWRASLLMIPVLAQSLFYAYVLMNHNEVHWLAIPLISLLFTIPAAIVFLITWIATVRPSGNRAGLSCLIVIMLTHLLFLYTAVDLTIFQDAVPYWLILASSVIAGLLLWASPSSSWWGADVED
jgi:hypothetical protein